MIPKLLELLTEVFYFELNKFIFQIKFTQFDEQDELYDPRDDESDCEKVKDTQEPVFVSSLHDQKAVNIIKCKEQNYAVHSNDARIFDIQDM